MNSSIIKKGGMFGLDARIAMLVLAILGLLVYPTVSGVISKARVEAIITSAKITNTAIENYILDVESIPASKNQLFTTAPTNAGQATRWKGPYLKGEPTGRFIPSLVWTIEDDDCTNGAKSSRYCTYRVSYSFCKFPKSVYVKLKNYYASVDQVVSYNTGTQCILLEYGYAENAGVETFVSFKVKEKP